METLPEATSLVQWAASEFKREKYDELLQSGFLTRVREGLGGSHTVVTYPPLDTLAPLTAEEVLNNVRRLDHVSLYAHIAFCEHLCPFCHYAKTYSPLDGESDLMQLYLEALFTEIGTWMQIMNGSTTTSVYIGGGTPTILSETRLVSLLDRLLSLPKAPNFVASIEASPITVCAPGGKEKLEALVNAGVNRISIGIQTFDDSLLRATRAHGKELAIKALELVDNLSVEYNVDLIQDLPYQTDDSIVHDLEWIKRFRPHQVTWYILRVHQESAWYRLYKRKDLDFPATCDSVRRRILIREGMRRIGYMPRPGGRFVSDVSVHDRFKEVRAHTDTELLGMGAAAYSHAWGYFFRNISSPAGKAGVRDYIEKVQREGLAVESGLFLTPIERSAGKLVAGIRSGVQLPEPYPGAESYIEQAGVILLRLKAEGLVDISGTGMWALTERGTLFEEEICSLFYSEPLKLRLSERDEHRPNIRMDALTSMPS